MAKRSGTGDVSSRVRLNRALVLDTAIAIADESGIESLTMRKLGEQLGVEAMSLYNHVANKDDLLTSMVDAVFAEIELPSHNDDWKSALRKRSVSFRDALSRHPWAIGVKGSGTNPGPATLRHHDRVIATFRNAGFSITMTAHAFSALDSYIYGFAMQEQSLPFTTEEETAAMAHILLAQLPTKEFPYLAELTAQHVLTPGYNYADEFPLGLDLILDGLERWL
ncbi:TetR/AcrR family transcriptional regulator C-terminal domain-containing protein [Subtercola frigoramans]|uniref:AcrR family transcriptional regulator n=1 Tax=Subtercola frigoramans TaxID=120298 RepID=A0ABS2L5U1_9MICO|nr:TetR/AcrR family transcriptional regulator C-terminal domain-containing protein [Subtercola frigoramans]MBM7472454.1 AcrR family transcriptional regulator [Subtercola frigoramans]